MNTLRHTPAVCLVALHPGPHSFSRLLLIVLLLAGLNGCGDDSLPGSTAAQPSDSSPQVSPSLAERLLSSLDERETWPSNGVKIWLKNPTVSVTLSLPDDDPVEVHAWAHNENDFNIAMMRLDRGDTLYAITDDEFQALKKRETPTAVQESEAE